MTETEAMEILKKKLIVEGDLLMITQDAHLDPKVIDALEVLEKFFKEHTKSIGW